MRRLITGILACGIAAATLGVAERAAADTPEVTLQYVCVFGPQRYVPISVTYTTNLPDPFLPGSALNLEIHGVAHLPESFVEEMRSTGATQVAGGTRVRMISASGGTDTGYPEMGSPIQWTPLPESGPVHLPFSGFAGGVSANPATGGMTLTGRGAYFDLHAAQENGSWTPWNADGWCTQIGSVAVIAEVPGTPCLPAPAVSTGPLTGSATLDDGSIPLPGTAKTSIAGGPACPDTPAELSLALSPTTATLRRGDSADLEFITPSTAPDGTLESGTITTTRTLRVTSYTHRGETYSIPATCQVTLPLTLTVSSYTRGDKTTAPTASLTGTTSIPQFTACGPRTDRINATLPGAATFNFSF